MEEKYLNLIESFKQLDINDKKEEIIKNIQELLKLLYLTNKNIDDFNTMLPVFDNYENEEEYFNLLFSYIISIKEENAKLINSINSSDLL